MEAIKIFEQYEKTAYTKNYIIGIKLYKHVYAAFCDGNALTPFLIDGISTKDGEPIARLNLTRYACEQIKRKASALIKICDIATLEEEAKNMPYAVNRGNAFEKLMFEYYGLEWTPNPTPYTEAGDIELDGVPYQIKYNRGEFKPLNR